MVASVGLDDFELHDDPTGLDCPHPESDLKVSLTNLKRGESDFTIDVSIIETRPQDLHTLDGTESQDVVPGIGVAEGSTLLAATNALTSGGDDKMRTVEEALSSNDIPRVVRFSADTTKHDAPTRRRSSLSAKSSLSSDVDGTDKKQHRNGTHGSTPKTEPKDIQSNNEESMTNTGSDSNNNNNNTQKKKKNVNAPNTDKKKSDTPVVDSSRVGVGNERLELMMQRLVTLHANYRELMIRHVATKGQVRALQGSMLDLQHRYTVLQESSQALDDRSLLLIEDNQRLQTQIESLEKMVDDKSSS